MLNIGIYGANGHQIVHLFPGRKNVRLAAAAAFKSESLPVSLRGKNAPRLYGSLDELLADPEIDLVSLCSPRRADQAGDAIKSLKAGKHVYAEKPCALSEKDLDRIIETAEKTGFHFHEMAGTTFAQPYLSLRERIKSGVLGTIIQIFVQKSYPYVDTRPQDEGVDGGLTLQVGIHALRLVEHTAGVRVRKITGIETDLGNPKSGGLKMASSLVLSLENGGVGSVVLNYLNPHSFGNWGNEHLRVFGTGGFIESVDGGSKTRLVTGEKDWGQVSLEEPGKEYFDFYAESLSEGKAMPFSVEEELHPLRVLLEVKQKWLPSS
ncbi:MAG: Gfo/Idh/MocA family oxidoreductase [Treponema sp.]|jgi:predicted dehydrogenase|nr:Gfo/Idh/MocA family oxidoreductase [Treponema sp.]